MERDFKQGLLCLVALLASVAMTAGADEKQLRIVTGPASAVYYPLGKGVADVLGKAIPGYAASAEASNASVENIRLVSVHKAEIGFAQADAAWDGYKGFGKFTEPMPIRAIAVLYSNRLHLVTLRESSVKKVADLRGKRVSVGIPGSAAEVWAARLLEANGLNPQKDVVSLNLGPSESAAALKEKKIDAFIWPGGVPIKAISDLASTPDIKIRLVDTADAVPTMLRKYGPVYTDGAIPMYRAGQIPLESYPGVDKPVRVAEVWNLLVVREDMDEALVYNIVKALFEHKPELIAAHVAAEGLDLSTQTRGGSPIPFHPGAKRYFRENGFRFLR